MFQESFYAGSDDSPATPNNLLATRDDLVCLGRSGSFILLALVYADAVTSYPLRKLRLRPGDEHRDEVQIQLEPFELGGERYLPVPAEVPAELTINRATGGDVFRLRFETRLHGPCVRCLEDASIGIAVDVHEYHSGERSSDEQLTSVYVVDDRLELSVWARDAIALELPEQILCRPDCAGLCPVCGKNLNHEPHEHEEDTGDPRWAALEQLRDRL